MKRGVKDDDLKSLKTGVPWVPAESAAAGSSMLSISLAITLSPDKKTP